jgi:hypothetical protein
VWGKRVWGREDGGIAAKIPAGVKLAADRGWKGGDDWQFFDPELDMYLSR